MAKKLQLRGGTTSEHSTFTGASREVTVDTDKDTLVVHDGVSAGGIPLAKAIDTGLLNDTSPQLGGDLDLNGHEIIGLPPANERDFVASGALSTGDIVSLNSDGTVSVISSHPEALGTSVSFESANTIFISATYDSANDKIVIAYRDNNVSGGDYGTAVVGTVSGTSISFGTPVTFESAVSSYISATYDSANEKIVIAYQTNATGSYLGTAVVGTVSGTSISFGTPVAFASGSASTITTTYDSVNSKVVISWYQGIGRAIVGTVSGTSISFGTVVSLTSTSVNYISSTFDSVNGKVVITYQNDAPNYYGSAKVGTVSGTSISFGSEAVFSGTSVAQRTAATYDSVNGKIVVAYEDDSNGGFGTAAVGAVSGTGISFGTPVVFSAGTNGIEQVSVVYDASSGKIVFVYTNDANSGFGTSIVGTVSGTSITFGTTSVFQSVHTRYPAAVYDSASESTVISYQATGISSYGTSVVYQLAGSTAKDVVGITTAAITDTATGAVTLSGGISSGHTGLTINANYYITDAGALTTAAGSNTRIGRALSTTELLLEEIGE